MPVWVWRTLFCLGSSSMRWSFQKKLWWKTMVIIIKMCFLHLKFAPILKSAIYPQVCLDAHLHQEVIYSACFPENREETRLLIKSSKALWVLRVSRRKLFKWPRSSTMEMWAVAECQCGIFTCLFITTLACFYPAGRPAASLLFRWIHINTPQKLLQILNVLVLTDAGPILQFATQFGIQSRGAQFFFLQGKKKKEKD